MASNNELIIYYQNVRGLRTKCSDLYNNILNENYDILLFTETWLQSDIHDGELCDARYDVFRCDRDLRLCGKRSGGGVMISIRRDLSAKLYTGWVSDTAESLCVRVPAHRLSSQTDLFIIIVYTPPSCSGFSDRINNILDNIIKLTQKHPNCNYLLVGDFNLPIIQWEKDGCTVLQQGSADVQSCAVNLVDQLHFLNFQQYNFIRNSKNNVLDLCFSNLPLNITQPTQPLLKEDTYHPSILIDILDLKSKQFKEKRCARFIFHKGNYEDINKYFDKINWYEVLSSESIDNDLKTFYGILQDCCDLFVPKSKVSSTRSHYPAWYSRDLIKIVKQKNKIHKRWKRFCNPRDYDEFSLLRDRVKTIQSQCFSDFTKRSETIIKNSPKCFWTYVKSKNKGSNYPREFTFENNVLSKGQDVCNAFNMFFESVFIPSSSSDHSMNSPSYKPSESDTVSTINISPALIEKLLGKLDKTKGAGCDGIPPIFLANCAKSLAYPIYIIFTKSLKTSVFPSMWKKITYNTHS